MTVFSGIVLLLALLYWVLAGRADRSAVRLLREAKATFDKAKVLNDHTLEFYADFKRRLPERIEQGLHEHFAKALAARPPALVTYVVGKGEPDELRTSDLRVARDHAKATEHQVTFEISGDFR